MITGTAEGKQTDMDNVNDVQPSPPSIVYGKDIFMIISPVETLAIELETAAGKIEVNIGLEM